MDWCGDEWLTACLCDYCLTNCGCVPGQVEGEEEGTLLSVSPKFNVLNLVMRDQQVRTEEGAGGPGGAAGVGGGGGGGAWWMTVGVDD